MSTLSPHMPTTTIIVSANAEWRAVRQLLPSVEEQQSPLGEWFTLPLQVKGRSRPVLFFHGGWGKIAAAASAQYVIDRWSPELLVNLGTCGGFEGLVEKGQILLVERTLVYDIVEQMGDPDGALAHYGTEVDLSWLSEPYPQPVLRTLLVSADRDLFPQDVTELHARFGAIAGDWESGAIAWVAARNAMRCLILRGVSDLVSASSGEAYGNIEIFHENTLRIMKCLLEGLPAWLEAAAL